MDEAVLCVNCGAAVSQDEAYCASCGTEHASGVKGKGPYTFAFPESKSAYEPSGKTTPLAVILLLIVAAVLIPFLGLITYGADRVVSEIALAIASIVPILGIIAGFIMWGFTGVFIGMASAYALSQISKLGKNRSPKLVAAVAGFTGFAGGMALLLWRKQFLGVAGDNSFFDMAKVITYALTMTMGGWAFGLDMVKRMIFCETCQKFMQLKSSRAHVSEEKRLYEWLSGKNYLDIGADLCQTKDKENYCEINLYTCPNCSAGCVELTSVQTRFETDKNNNTKKNTQRRMILSMMVATEEAKSLTVQLLPA